MKVEGALGQGKAGIPGKGDDDEHQGIAPPDQVRDLGKEALPPKGLHHDEHPQGGPPHQVVEAHAVPQAHQHGDEHDIEGGGQGAVVLRTQGPIDVFSHKAVGRDVKAGKEIGDRICLEGVMEVLRQLQAENPPDAAGHIAEAGKGVIDLEDGADDKQPHRKHRLVHIGNLPQLLGEHHQGIGQNHLFGKAVEEEHHPPAHPRKGGPKLPQLAGKVAVGEDGAHIELAEEAAEQAVFVEAGGQVRLPAVKVHQIPQAGEGVNHHPNGHLGIPQLAPGGEGDEKEDVFGRRQQQQRPGPAVPLPPQEKGLCH